MIMNNQDGGTPLYVAAAGGHRDIVQLLLNKGANIGVTGVVSHRIYVYMLYY